VVAAYKHLLCPRGVAFMIARWSFRMKAIFVPSGDHAGSVSCVSVVVIATWLEQFALIRWMFW
jgi:hypothetical protein